MNAPKTYQIPADLMQGVVNALGSMPWAQVNGIMAPLVTTIQQQDAAPVLPAVPQPDLKAPD